MKTKLPLFVVFFMLTTTVSFAQVAINTDGSAPNSSAMLDVKSTDKGLLIPRLTTAQRNALSSTAVAGLMVYDTDVNRFFFFNGFNWDEGSVGGLWSKNIGTNTYLTDLNSKLGIGTNAPVYAVDINPSVGSSWIRTKSNTAFAGLIIDKGSTAQKGYIMYKTNEVDKWFVGTIGDDNYAISTTYTAPDGKFYIENTGNVGIGTTTPARKLEIDGGAAWQVVRINSISTGAIIEFKSNNTINWSFGALGGSARLFSTVDNFANVTDQYYFTTTSFYPYANNARTLGITTKRWSNLYSVAGDFSGAVATGALTTTGNANITGNTIVTGTLASGNLSVTGNGTLTGTGSIGTITQRGNLHIYDPNGYATIYLTPSATNDSSSIFFGEDPGGAFAMYWMYHGGVNQMQLKSKVNATYYGPHISVTRQTGNVAIGGEFASGYKLSVGGKIICEELRVDLIAGWPDYVFGKDYQLMSINDLDTYIQKNGHLPNIPEAGEIQESGLEVGEMQRLMMEKIEELSIYIIQQQKEIEELKSLIHKNQN